MSSSCLILWVPWLLRWAPGRSRSSSPLPYPSSLQQPVIDWLISRFIHLFIFCERNNVYRLNLRSAQGFYVPSATYQYLNNFPLIKCLKLWNELRAVFKYSLVRHEFIRQLKHLFLDKLINSNYVTSTSLMDLYNLVD